MPPVCGFVRTATIRAVAASNDVIHLDQHGAVLVSEKVVKQIPVAVYLITKREAVILDSVRSGNSTIKKLQTAMGKVINIHQASAD